MKSSIVTRWAAATAVAVTSLVVVPGAPAAAAPDNGDVVINEVYLNGGSAGATYAKKFIELYNPTSAAIDLSGWSIQYKSSAGTTISGNSALGTRSIGAGKTFLIEAQGNSGTPVPPALPTADVVSTLNPSGSAGGVIALSKSTAALSAATPTALLADPNLVDLIGYGTADTFEGAAEPAGYTITTSLTRASDGADTDDNADDFGPSSPPTPLACGEECAVTTPPVVPPVAKTIAEVQGEGFTSPLVGTNVTVEGVVTATYRSGLFDGAYVQTEGTGDVDLATHTASDGIFDSSLAFANGVAKGDFVEVTGVVSESFGLTQIATPADGWKTVNGRAHNPVEPASVTFPMSSATRESLEGTLLDVDGAFTVTNNYTTDRYGDIGLVDGDEPLDQPTNVVAPGAEANALQDANDARLITLDDGSDVDRFSVDKGIDLPWLTASNEVRVGATATIDEPVILDYRRSLWRLQPTERLVAGAEPASFTSTRQDAPKDVGGDVKIGTFNVLNYFTTTAEAYDALPGNSCTYFTDRDGNKITADTCSGTGPRGAANAASLQRQQDKIVTAINTLDADVVSLEEVENSATFGPDRDAALGTLVAALNAASGEDRWAFVPSPAQVPDDEDVIRTAFIYQPDVVETVGASTILIGNTAFDNARQPLAQAFKPVGASEASRFAVIVNHFKSKGSSSLPQDADTFDGQGPSNYSRKLQATALVAFAETIKDAADTDRVFLTGDFNSYNREDPVGIIEAAGYVNVAAELTDKETYQFDGQVGSLDHVFASAVAFEDVTDADIWNINSFESPGREYSRFNYNAVDLFDGTTPFRASDHDPEIVGFSADAGLDVTTTTATAPTSIRSGSDLTVKVSVGGGATPTGTVAVTEAGKELATGALVDGTAEMVVKDLPIGSHSLAVTYSGDKIHAESSTMVETQVLRATSGLSATAAPGTYGTGTTLTVTAEPGATGFVQVVAGGQLVGIGSLVGGAATIQLSSTLPVGTTPMTVFYAGNGSYDPTSTATSVTVAKASTSITRISVTPTTIVRDRTKPFVELRVTAAGFTVEGGTVTVRQGGKNYAGTVKNGKVRVRLGTFTSSGPRKKVTVTYSGNAVANGSTTSFTVKVRKR